MKLSDDERDLELKDDHIHVIVAVLVSKMTHRAGLNDEYAKHISYSQRGKYQITSIPHTILTKLMFNHFPSYLLDNDLVIGTPIYTKFLSHLAGEISKNTLFKKSLRGFNYFKHNKPSADATNKILQHYKEKYQ